MNKKKTIKFAGNSQRSITGKGDDACVKRKKWHFPLDKGDESFFLFQAVTSGLITSCWCFGHHAYVFGRSVG